MVSVDLSPCILSELDRVHPRFTKKAVEWARLIRERGIHFAQKLKGDHPLQSFKGDRREGMWATRLNHRYRLIYRIEGDRVLVVRVDNHNKQFY
jgi:Txe/YoeB family toxin of Txe-Axe toxin-antitoxin module